MPSASPIATFRAAQAHVANTRASRALQPAARPPAPPISASVGRADTEAEAWVAVMTALTTSVATVATAQLVATLDPAYATIAEAATKLQTTVTKTLGEIEAAGQAILQSG